MASAATDYFGSGEEMEIEAGNIFQLVKALDKRASGFADAAGVTIIFAVDGVVAENWSAPLPAGAEVLLVPKIGGG